MIYTINYDIKGTDRSIAFVSRVKEFGETELCLPNALFLDTEAPCSEIYNKLKEGLKPSDLFWEQYTCLPQRIEKKTS